MGRSKMVVLYLFIDNGTGDYFHETVAAAERINASEVSKSLNQIAVYFPKKHIPKVMSRRRNEIDRLNEKYTIIGEKFDSIVEEYEGFWNGLDQHYYKNPDYIPQKLIDYLKTNATLVD